MWRVVIRPLLLRPPVLDFFSSSGAYGAPLCRSCPTTLTTKRRPAEVGLHLTIAMMHPFTQRCWRNRDLDLAGERCTPSSSHYACPDHERYAWFYPAR